MILTGNRWRTTALAATRQLFLAAVLTAPVMTSCGCLSDRAGAVAERLNSAPPRFDVPRLERVVVDGKVDDWGDGGLRVDMLRPLGGGPLPEAADQNCRVRLAWDEGGLLVLAVVDDDQWRESDDDTVLWGSDSVEVLMSPQRGHEDIAHWGLSPGMQDTHPDLRQYPYHRFTTETLKQQEVEVEAARTRTAGGYVMEVRMPWRAVGVSPEMGREVAFQIQITDRDDSGSRPIMVWYPEFGAFFNSMRMHRVRLTDQASPGARLLVDSAYDVERLQPMFTCMAQAETIGREVAILDGDNVLSRAALVADGRGRAKAELPLPLPPEGRGYAALAVRLDGVTVETIDLPHSGNLHAVSRFVSDRERIRVRFSVDRPWDAMAGAPAVVRKYRGLVARALDLLSPDASPRLTELLRTVGEAAKAVEAADGGPDTLDKRRAEFWLAYYSAADGSGQPFLVGLPPGYDPAKRYSLVVSLHGSGGTIFPDETYDESYIRVRPWARGPSHGYEGLSGNDVLEVVRHMKRWYPVDPDRVYLTGASMGGGGAWAIASQYPDLFAAVSTHFGAAIDLPLENLRNVPVMNQHGALDWVIPIDCSRYAISALQQRGYFAAHIEFPDDGHGINQPYPDEDWMLAQRRPIRVDAITYSCQTPDMGRAYWLAVRRMTDPHAVATVQANVTGRETVPVVTLDLTNVAALELDIAAMGIDRSKGIAVQIGRDFLESRSPLGERLFVVRDGDAWTLRDGWAEPDAASRPYRAGAAANLYTGEPLLVVYGTRGSDETDALLREAAEKLTTFSGGSDSPMVFGRIPIKADVDVTDEDLQHYNMILLGMSRDNSLVARLADGLPLRINAANELLAGDREPISLDGAGLRLAYYNPLAPKRLIFLVATSDTGEKARAWLMQTEWLMTGSAGLQRIDQPDLVVQTLDSGDRRRMQFTHGWAWRQVDGADRRFPESFRTELQYKQAEARATRSATGTDFAFGWEGLWQQEKVDFAHMTAADLATFCWPRQTLVARMSGRDLIDIHQRWVAKGEIAVAPTYTPQDIDPDRSYSVSMAPSVCWKLGRRHKNLDDVQAGPQWRPEKLLTEIFGPGAAKAGNERETPTGSINPMDRPLSEAYEPWAPVREAIVELAKRGGIGKVDFQVEPKGDFTVPLPAGMTVGEALRTAAALSGLAVEVSGDAAVVRAGERRSWHDLVGAKEHTIEVRGYRGSVLMPTNRKGDGPVPWVWYAPHSMWPHHAWMVKRLMAEGVAVASLCAGETFGSPRGREAFTAFYEKIVPRFNLTRQAVLLPQSRGGLMLYNWAAEHPDCVAAVGGMYPWCDLKEANEGIAGAYGMSVEELKGQLASHSPIERLEPLAKAAVTIFHIHGDKDDVLPVAEHSAPFVERYRKLGGDARLEIIPGGEHEVSERFFRSPTLTDFLVARAKAVAARQPDRQEAE